MMIYDDYLLSLILLFAFTTSDFPFNKPAVENYCFTLCRQMFFVCLFLPRMANDILNSIAENNQAC